MVFLPFTLVTPTLVTPHPALPLKGGGMGVAALPLKGGGIGQRSLPLKGEGW